MSHAPTARLRLALPTALVAALAAGCSGIPRTTDPLQVPATLDRAEAEAEAGDLDRALKLALGTRAAEGLSPELRERVERTIETYAARRIAELEASGEDPDDLEDMLDYDLPRQLAVSAGITAARLRHERGEEKKAFGLIRELDRQYPAHHERTAAGQILMEVGFELLEREPWFFGWFGGPGDAIPVLEYMVLRYPSAPRCDEAYARLADLYVDDRDYRRARQRYEDLLLYHPDSALAVEAEVQVPRLRMAGLASPEYDRRQLVLALGELEQWLGRHAGHPLEQEVRLDLADCLLRLAESDFTIARFYAKVDKTRGALLHGERAIELARRARDEPLAADVSEFLAALPPAPGEDALPGAEEDDERPDTPAPLPEAPEAAGAGEPVQ